MQFLQNLNKILLALPYWIFLVITQGIQMVGVGLIAYINHAPLQCIFIYLSMIFSRNVFGKSFHAKSYWVCTSITFFVFYILTASVPPLYASIYSSAFLGILTSYFMYHVARYEECRTKLKEIEKREKLNNFILIKGMDKNVLLERCSFKQLTAYETELLVLTYTTNLKIKNVIAQLDCKYEISRSKYYEDLKQLKIKIET